MLSRVYQYVNNINVSLPNRRGPGIFMKVSVRDHHDLNNYFDVTYLTITPLSLLSSCSLPFPIVGLEIFSLPNFLFKSPNRIS
jgi:hypothetical protein